MPLTAHFIGGCAIGDSSETGVIDPYQRVFGHPGLHVADGSAVTANLGVNPSLTITAQAERAMSFWPNKGEDDPRPGPRRGVRARPAGRAARARRTGLGAGGPPAAHRRRQLTAPFPQVRHPPGISGPDRGFAPRNLFRQIRNPPPHPSLSASEPGRNAPSL